MFQTFLPSHGSSKSLGGLDVDRLMGRRGGGHEDGLEKLCLECKMKFKKENVKIKFICTLSTNQFKIICSF